MNFLAEQVRSYPTFRLMMKTEAKALIEEQGRIARVRADAPDGSIEVRADLIVAADGRSSVVRECAGLVVEEIGAPTGNPASIRRALHRQYSISLVNMKNEWVSLLDT